jgi:hypothetical protein
MGYGCVCVFFLCVCSIAWAGGSRRVGVQKGGVLAFIGVHGGLVFLFRFTPGVFVLYLYIATRIGAGGVWLCLSLVVGSLWPCLYLGGTLVRSYIFYSVISISCLLGPSQILQYRIHCSKWDIRYLPLLRTLYCETPSMIVGANLPCRTGGPQTRAVAGITLKRDHYPGILQG